MGGYGWEMHRNPYPWCRILVIWWVVMWVLWLFSHYSYSKIYHFERAFFIACCKDKEENIKLLKWVLKGESAEGEYSKRRTEFCPVEYSSIIRAAAAKYRVCWGYVRSLYMILWEPTLARWTELGTYVCTVFIWELLICWFRGRWFIRPRKVCACTVKKCFFSSFF